MTAPDIRFDCRFCNKPVRVPAKHAGKRVKCPACKNPVVVPGQQDTMAASFTEAESSPGQLKMVSDKPITRGGSSLPLGKLIGFGLLLAVAFFGWRYIKGQAAKPLDKLLSEYADGNMANGPIIKRKVEEAAKKGTVGDFEVGELTRYAGHKKEKVRELMMECLALTGNKGAYGTLQKGLTKDENADVRRAAAIALGGIREKRVIQALVDAMQTESEQTVRGGIRQALVALTGQKQFKAQPAEWKTWWGLNKKKFYFPE